MPGGASVAVKRPKKGAVTGALARAALKREHAAYARLAGIPGVPRLYGFANRDWLVIEFVAGHSLREAQHEIGDRERFFGRLLATIRAMHAAGVAHGDLKRKDNVIVTDDGRPFLIDFGIARIRGRSAIDDSLFAFTRQLDLNAWIKLKYGGRPATMTAADAALYRPQLVERVARWIRVPWQKVTLRRPRQRLRRWLEKRSERR
jgi:predicted Ser/Thr protein kinase